MNEDLLPARMASEFVYCPRLFYLEWAQGRFVDNDETRLGRQVHRRVGTEAGAAPLPRDGQLRTARSVALSSLRLGVTASSTSSRASTVGSYPSTTRKAVHSQTARRGRAMRSTSASKG